MKKILIISIIAIISLFSFTYSRPIGTPESQWVTKKEMQDTMNKIYERMEFMIGVGLLEMIRESAHAHGFIVEVKQ